MRYFALLLFAFSAFSVALQAAPPMKWAGMRNPCKVSAEDGLDTKSLGKKIGKFILLENEQEWVTAIKTVSGRFPAARPWVTWGVGKMRDATPLTDEANEKYLTEMDKQGIDVFIEVWPEKNDDATAMIDAAVAKVKHHPSVVGVCVDLEYYKGVDDASAKEWDEKIKSHNPAYRLMMKHWQIDMMPPDYRGKGDLIFCDNSSEATVDFLNAEYVKWAEHFSPSAVAFMIGYPCDEDGMDGDPAKGWSALKDPIKEWGEKLLAGIKNDQQEVGILWVCAKSGKTYNSGWDLTKGQATPGVKAAE